MAAPFSKLPAAATINPTPFRVSVPQEQLDELQLLLKVSKIAPPTYENSLPDRRYGVTSEWLTAMREEWKNDFNWRACEDRVNTFPQFTVDIEDIKLHFAALFSEKPDAVPIILNHGWPGSYFEFLPMLQLFRDEFTPSTLPFHLIVPSLPGYAFSSGPPLDRNFRNDDTARILNQLMHGLGFGDGYIAQGGDIGSTVSQKLAAGYDSCKAAHLNFCPLPDRPASVPENETLTVQEQKGLERKDTFMTLGRGYGIEQGTRPSTIGHVLSSSPIALLAWVGEKYLEWVDEALSSNEILELVSLYWFTESFPRAIYPYREPQGVQKGWHIPKPFGFSYFPKEIIPIPKSWVQTVGNLVFWRQHDKGGHFAALEKPQELKEDLTAFVKQVW